jgi:hypothetical protein
MTRYKCFDEHGIPFAQIDAMSLTEALKYAQREGRIVQRVDVPEGQGWHTLYLRGEFDE